MTPLLLTATSPHLCDARRSEDCAQVIFRGDLYRRRVEQFRNRKVVSGYTSITVRECASCADQAGRWTP